MKVFLSWSGEASHKVALALHEWLPDVIQALKPWVSTEIDKGEKWLLAISEALKNSEGYGIFCLTPTNLDASWLSFEAGALASHDRGRVATFLHGVEPSAVRAPLGMFQATVSSSRDDVFRLVTGLNSRETSPLSDALLQKAFAANWEALESKLAEIKEQQDTTAEMQDDPMPVLSEILAVVRRLERDAVSGPGVFGLPVAFTSRGPGLLSGSLVSSPEEFNLSNLANDRGNTGSR